MRYISIEPSTTASMLTLSPLPPYQDSHSLLYILTPFPRLPSSTPHPQPLSSILPLLHPQTPLPPPHSPLPHYLHNSLSSPSLPPTSILTLSSLPYPSNIPPSLLHLTTLSAPLLYHALLLYHPQPLFSTIPRCSLMGLGKMGWRLEGDLWFVR